MAVRKITGNKLIKASLRVLGVHDEHTTPTHGEMDNALEALILLIEQLSGPPDSIDMGLKPWLRETGTLTLTATNSYNLKPSGDLDIEIPEGIITATRRNTDDVDNLLTPLTLQDYNEITNKSQTGTPQAYYYEREKDNGLFLLDYIPSNTDDTIILDYRRRIESPTLTGNIDVSEPVYRMLKFNLAMELAPEYGKKLDETLVAFAAQSKTKLSAHYPENATQDMYFQPDKDI